MKKKSAGKRTAESSRKKQSKREASEIKQPETSGHGASFFSFERILIVIILAGVLAAGYRVVDYYTGWGNDEKVIKRMFDSAEKYSVYKKHDEAAAVYEEILKKWGDSANYAAEVKQARLNLAKAYKDSENHIKAINLYRELIEEYRELNNDMYAWLMLELGDAYNAVYNSEDAIKVYSDVIEKFSDTDWSAEALFGIADAYRNMKDYNNAVKYYDMIVKKYKKGFLSAEALTAKAMIYEEKGELKKALSVYSKVIKDFPEIVTEYARRRHGALSDNTAE